MKKQSTSKGFAVLTITNFICKILAIIYVPIQTAIVGDRGNSVISYGYIIYLFVYQLSAAGIPSSISRLVSEQNATGNYKNSRKIFHTAFLVLLAFGFIFLLFLALGSNWLATTFKHGDSALMLFTLSPVFIFTSINCALRGYFQGNQNMIPTAISNVTEQVLNSVSTAVLIYLFFNYTSKVHRYSNAAAGSAIGTIIGALGASSVLIFLYFVTRKGYLKRERQSAYSENTLSYKAILGRLFKYIIPALIGTIASSASDIIDALNSIPRMMVGGLTQLKANIIYGQYTTIYQRLLSVTTIVAISLMISLIPAISRACSLKDKREIRHKFNQSLKALYIFIIPCLTAFSLFSKPLVSLIFFNVNQKGYNFITYWSWTNIFISLIMIQTAILIGIGKPLTAPMNLIIGMAVKLVLNYFLISIPSLNMNGAALGSAIGYIITAVLDAYAIKKNLNIKIFYFRLAVKPLIFSAIVSLTYFLYVLLNSSLLKFLREPLIISDVSFIICMLIAGSVYAVLTVKSRALTESEILNLPLGGKIVSVFKKIRLL